MCIILLSNNVIPTLTYLPLSCMNELQVSPPCIQTVLYCTLMYCIVGYSTELSHTSVLYIIMLCITYVNCMNELLVSHTCKGNRSWKPRILAYGEQSIQIGQNKCIKIWPLFISYLKKLKNNNKNPAYGRHQLSQTMRIVWPIQNLRGHMIYLIFFEIEVAWFFFSF